MEAACPQAVPAGLANPGEAGAPRLPPRYYLRNSSCQRVWRNKMIKILGHSINSIRSADLQGCLVLAGLRLFAELKAAESNIDSALQLAFLCRTVAIF
jgi:hypothetical protein